MVTLEHTHNELARTRRKLTAFKGLGDWEQVKLIRAGERQSAGKRTTGGSVNWARDKRK